MQEQFQIIILEQMYPMDIIEETHRLQITELIQQLI